MFKKFTFLIIFYLFMSNNFVMAEKKSLSNYLWENRLFIISYKKGNADIKNSIEEFIQKNQCEIWYSSGSGSHAGTYECSISGSKSPLRYRI